MSVKTKIDGGRTASFRGELRVLAETRGLQQKVEVWLLNDEVNQNNWRYVNLREHMPLFAETPLLVAYVGGRVGDSHNFDEIKNADGTVSYSFMSATAERIVGYFKSAEDIRVEVVDGKTWIVGTGYIWRWYARELVAKLEKQGLRGMAVSIETLIDEGHIDGEVEVFTRYQILGTTILGDGVAPAVADASIRVLSAIGVDEVRRMTLRVASENQNNHSKNSNKGVKGKAMKITEVQAKIPDFKVLAVNGENVALLSADGEPYVCTAKSENGEIIVGAKMAVDKLSLCADGTSVEVESDKLTAVLSARCRKAEADLAEEKTARVNAEEELGKMKKAEMKRRCEAVKTALNDRLDEINANRGLKIDKAICTDMLTEDAVARFAAMEDGDGNFIGDVCAKKELDSRCMEKVIEADVAKNSASRKHYAWEDHRTNSVGNDNGVLGAVKRLAGNK